MPEEREDELAYSQAARRATGFCPQHLAPAVLNVALAAVAGLSSETTKGISAQRWRCGGSGGETAPRASSHLHAVDTQAALVLGRLEKEH